MSVISWIILGWISCFLAGKIVNKSGEGFLLDTALGIIGAVVGGWLFDSFGDEGVGGLNLYSFLGAIVGGVLLLVAYHAVRRASRKLPPLRTGAEDNAALAERFLHQLDKQGYSRQPPATVAILGGVRELASVIQRTFIPSDLADAELDPSLPAPGWRP